MSIEYKRLTENELDIFIEMRINQLREEGAKEDIDLKPALKDYYSRHMTEGTFVSWICSSISTSARDSIWGTVAAVLIVGGTIAEDVITGGGGIADDAAFILSCIQVDVWTITKEIFYVV